MLKRWIFICLAIVGTASAQLAAQTESYSETDNNRQTYETLEQSVTVAYREIEFSEILDDLSQQSGLQFWLHESALENGLDQSTAFSTQLSNTRLATVFALMLQPHQCTYSVKDGIVQILSEDAALDNLNTQVIDCRDLLAQIKPKKVHVRAQHVGGVFAIRDAPATQGFGGVVRPRQENPQVNSQSNGSATNQPDQPRYYEVYPTEQLVDVIQETIDPDSWEENGGSGRLQEINGMLVITQTCANLRQIDILLEQLKRDEE